MLAASNKARLVIAKLDRSRKGAHWNGLRRAPRPAALALLPAGFFEADLLPLKEAAHRAATTGDPSLVHRNNDFVERQVRRRAIKANKKAACASSGEMLPRSV
jgi:hypothetical protein